MDEHPRAGQQPRDQIELGSCGCLAIPYRDRDHVQTCGCGGLLPLPRVAFCPQVNDRIDTGGGQFPVAGAGRSRASPQFGTDPAEAPHTGKRLGTRTVQQPDPGGRQGNDDVGSSQGCQPDEQSATHSFNATHRD